MLSARKGFSVLLRDPPEGFPGFSEDLSDKAGCAGALQCDALSYEIPADAFSEAAQMAFATHFLSPC